MVAFCFLDEKGGMGQLDEGIEEELLYVGIMTKAKVKSCGGGDPYMSFSELSILMVILLARSSTALMRVRLRHIQGGLVNRSFDMSVIF